MGATKFIAFAASVVLLLAEQSLADTGRPAPTVRTAAGEVRGRWVEVDGVDASSSSSSAEPVACPFAAYLGIPYATPPVGHLRYKFPKAPKSWDGPLDATKDPPPCSQINIQSATKEVIGQEDCLYINVYVPAGRDECPQRHNATTSMPVVFVVHGGAFEHGSGRMDAFGPHFLVNWEVVVVSVNYRLGALGFVSLDSEVIPGNAGLKDIVLALKWVKDNIATFGGDPSRVTAFGWSTGASAVHTLSLLPSTRELFSKAVLMSGHAISPRAYTERHIERANTLASILGAADNSSETVTRTLMDASVETILRASDDPRMRRVGHPLPSPERRVTKGSEPKLLQQDPESLLRQPKAAAMPVILSVGAREGTFPFKIWGLESRSPEALDELLPRLMPADLLPGADTAAMLGLTGASRGPGPLGKDASLRLAQLVRDEYSGGGPIANNADTFIEFLGDAFIFASTWRAVGFMANASTEAAPLRLYKFEVDSDFNYGKKLYGITKTGSSHLDDLGYVGRFDQEPNLHQDAGSAIARGTLRRMTYMITSFAKGDLASQASQWPEVSRGSTDPSSWPVLRVALRPGTRTLASGTRSMLDVFRTFHMETPHHAFWTSVYNDLRSRATSIGRT